MKGSKNKLTADTERLHTKNSIKNVQLWAKQTHTAVTVVHTMILTAQHLVD
jgi:hypothetical protein